MTLVSVTDIDTPEAPMLMLTGVALEIVKSPTWTMETTEWNVVPGEPVPVTLTRYEPSVEEFNPQDPAPVPLAASMMGDEPHVTVRPVLGATTELSVTEPAKLKKLLRVTEIIVPVAPELKLTEPLAEIEKSPTCTTDAAE